MFKVGDTYSGTVGSHEITRDGKRFVKVANYGEWPVGLINGPFWIEIQEEKTIESCRTGLHSWKKGIIVDPASIGVK
jgi:hypothetical protein